MVLASVSGNTNEVIARLVAADPDTVRDVIHAFNDRGLECLDCAGRAGHRGGSPSRTRRTSSRWPPPGPGRWAGRSPTGACASWPTTSPTHPPGPAGWSSAAPGWARPCAGTRSPSSAPAPGRRPPTRTPTPNSTASRRSPAAFPTGAFAFDQFGPLPIRPCPGTCWARRKHPDRLRATYHRHHGIGYFHGCYSLGDDTLWGTTRRRKGADHTLTALKSIRAARPDGAPIYVIADNWSGNKTPAIRAWTTAHKVHLCFTPTDASWANPIEPHFGPLRSFVIGNNDPPNHPALARQMQDYLTL
ncbi:transposase [Streptomyces sp. CA-106131]|uniref:transposase n=1 Tax=Streptomyces sp. CA-106131 TaxID=3240045 RepID=UPI003D8CAD7D